MVCDHQFEYFQKMTDDPLTECPNCGGSVRRLIGAGLSPIFKGTGFYQTDYKNNSGGKNSSAGKSDSTKKDKK
jgi:putative FmdB family regulatory protein